MYMKPSNGGKNLRLRAQTSNQKLKENAQTQDADGGQATCSPSKQKLFDVSGCSHPVKFFQ